MLTRVKAGTQLPLSPAGSPLVPAWVPAPVSSILEKDSGGRATAEKAGGVEAGGRSAKRAKQDQSKGGGKSF